MTTKTVRVLFTENAEVKLAAGDGPKYQAGKEYDLRPDQAQRWYVRGKAIPAPVQPANAEQTTNVMLLSTHKSDDDGKGVDPEKSAGTEKSTQEPEKTPAEAKAKSSAARK